MADEPVCGDERVSSLRERREENNGSSLEVKKEENRTKRGDVMCTHTPAGGVTRGGEQFWERTITCV